MPHLLIAGRHGLGQERLVNALITSLLMRATPDEVRLSWWTSSGSSWPPYNGLPHLLVPVITEAERGAGRAEVGRGRDGEPLPKLAGGHGHATSRPTTRRGCDPRDRLPYIVIIIDELADLMMREGHNVEDPIVRLAQKARATGIHLVLATQRPSSTSSRPHQGQLPEPDRLRDGVQDRQPDDPRPARRGGPHRPRRHALPAGRPAAADAAPGRLRVATREIRRVTELWRDQAPEPHYDPECSPSPTTRERRRPVRLAGPPGRGRHDAAGGRAGHARPARPARRCSRRSSRSASTAPAA